jgi:hypothetical protein
MVVALAFAVSWGVEWLMLLLVHHPIPKWVAGSAGGFTAIATGVIASISASRRGSKKDDDERLTPLVRRDARTGLRQL